MHLSQSPAQCLVDCRAKVRARYLPLSGQGVVIWSPPASPLELGTATLPSNLRIGATLLMTNSVSNSTSLTEKGFFSSLHLPFQQMEGDVFSPGSVHLSSLSHHHQCSSQVKGCSHSISLQEPKE